MPIYEYRCEQGHTFEVMQRMSDDPVVTCQTCAAPVERVFHPVAVHFKGSGFYTTDYGSRKPSSDGKESSEDAGKASKSEDGGKASKSEDGRTAASKEAKSTGSKSESSSTTGSSSSD